MHEYRHLKGKKAKGMSTFRLFFCPCLSPYHPDPHYFAFRCPGCTLWPLRYRGAAPGHGLYHHMEGLALQQINPIINVVKGTNFRTLLTLTGVHAPNRPPTHVSGPQRSANSWLSNDDRCTFRARQSTMG